MYKRLILRPLNRVKILIWPKMKLGLLDGLVFGIWVISSFVISFLSFDKMIIRAGVGLGAGGLGGIVLLIGTPGKRVYNYFWIIFSYLMEKQKYKNDNIDDLNPYLEIKQERLITKDGKFVAVYQIFGNDITYNLEDEIYKKLKSFEELFQSQSLTYQIVKQERKFNDLPQLKSLNSIKNPKNKTQSKIVSENIEIVKNLNKGEKYYAFYYIEFSSKNVNKISSESEHIENSLSNCGFRWNKIGNKELAIYSLKKYLPFINKSFNIENEKDENINMVSLWKKATQDNKIKFKTSYITFNNYYQKIIAIDEFPKYSSLAFLEQLFDETNTQIILQIRSIDSDEGQKMINKAYREMVSRNGNTNNKLSETQEVSIYLDSMEELMESIKGSGEELKAINMYISVFGNTFREYNSALRRTRKTIKKLRMKRDDLIMKQKEIWMSLPSNNSLKIEERNQIEIGSEALSHGWPFTSASFNDESGDFIGISQGGKPSFLDWKLRNETLNRHQSNSIIFGVIGAGKSIFTKKILKDEWSRGVSCYVFDPEGEYQRLAKNLNGRIINLSGAPDKFGKNEKINPLQVLIEDNSDEKVSVRTNYISNHFRFISDFFSQLLYPSLDDTVIQMNYLKFAISNLYKKHKISRESVLTKKAKDYPTISELYSELGKLSKKPPKDDFSKAEVFQDLKERLYDLTIKGTDGDLFDGKTTFDIKDDTFVVFDFRDLINSGNKRLIGAQSFLAEKYVMHVIFKNKEKAEREGRIQNVSITIDEAHRFINPDHPSSVLFAFIMYKQIRKYHGWIRLTTQNIADFTSDKMIKKETSAILNNCEFIFVFKLKPKDINDLDNLLKTSGGLTQNEKYFLAKDRSHQYLFIRGNYRSAIRVEYTPVEKQIMGWT